jgi:3-oxoacyl-[acyl-carrier-protein] synthase-3
MPPDARLLGLGVCLPGSPVNNSELATSLARDAREIEHDTGVAARHYASAGVGPSDLALEATHEALARAGTSAADLELIVFATATPDVCFPGAACYLQRKLGAPTVGAIDVRAQSAGFLAGLDLAAAFCSAPRTSTLGGPGYGRVLVAAGEVHSSGLDATPRGADMTPRFGDGAAVAIVGQGDKGARIVGVRWYTDGSLVERFWCEYPASRQYPLRVTPEDLEEGRHYPSADLPSLAGVVAERLREVSDEVLEHVGWSVESLAAVIVDYVDPRVARAAFDARTGLAAPIDVPTRRFGHVMAAGLAIRLAELERTLRPGARVLLAAAGPGLAWGAAAVEIGEGPA